MYNVQNGFYIKIYILGITYYVNVNLHDMLRKWSVWRKS